MTKEELNQVATVEDLEKLKDNIFNFLNNFFIEFTEKEFYTPKEFSKVTGLKYTTVINYCNNGNIKARQEGKRGAWVIHQDELKAYREQAQNNTEWIK